MKKLLRITVSLILVAILLVMAMPLYALEEVSVKEIEELREENVKHFDMGDGTYKVIVYSEPVHRKDSDGKWQDIDNTLKETDNNGNVDYATKDGRIKFSGKINNGSGKIFELSENGYKISFSYTNKNVKTASADIENHKTEKSTSIFDSSEERLEKLSRVDNLTRVRYNDIEKNTDIEYEIYSNNIKESIIVNGKQDAYEYTFELKLNKLIATLNEDGSISLNDEETGEVKYTMPAPFMFDDSGALSTDVYYTLTQSGKYKYELKVTASNEWINAKERDFPVTIDPTVNTVNSYYEEAYVSSSSPNTNYKKPSNGQLPVSSTYRTFMKFEMPELPDNAYITGAELYVNFYYNSSYDYTRIGLYKVPYSWNENTITWNNSVAAHQTEENATANFATEELSASFGATSSEPFEFPFDMTSAVRDWCAGAANNGIGIRFLSGSSNPIYFKGYNSGDTLRPKIEIAYVGMSDVLNGTFFLGNVEYYTYLQSDPYSLSNYDNTEMNMFHGDSEQRWNITYLNNGYHMIASCDNGKVLTATPSLGSDLILTTYSASVNQMWSITSDANGYYHISPRLDDSCYILANEDNVEIGGLQQDNKEEWVIATNIDYVLMYIGNITSDPLMPPILNSVKGALKSNAHMIGFGDVSLDKDYLLSLLTYTNMFSCITHGTRTTLTTSYGTLTVSDINSLDASALDDLKFVYLGACETGSDQGYGDNLVDAIYNKGADAVLGFKGEILIVEANYWTECFMIYLSEGETISDAMYKADVDTQEHFDYDDINDATTSEDDRYFRGNAQIIPCG